MQSDQLEIGGFYLGTGGVRRNVADECAVARHVAALAAKGRGSYPSTQ